MVDVFLYLAFGIVMLACLGFIDRTLKNDGTERGLVDGPVVRRQVTTVTLVAAELAAMQARIARVT